MELIPIQTRTLHPPQDDLFEVFDTTLTNLREGDVVCVTSKVVAIHEGRCVPMAGTDKAALVKEEAAHFLHIPGKKKPLTIVHHALISSAGIDESNGEGYYILLPQDAFRSAQKIRAHLCERHGLNHLGVVITDSHSLPFRYGALSVAVGCWGFAPIENHVGRPDLFGRIMEYSKTNIPDSIAAATTLVTGECDESLPITIVRGIPHLIFTEKDPRPELFVRPEDDMYSELYRTFQRGGRDEA